MVNLSSMKSFFYKIGFNTFIQIFGKAISIILGFISVGLLTRYLGQEGFGNFTLVFVYLSFFGTLANFGLQLTMVRDLAKKDKLPEEIYGTFFWLKIFLVVFATILAIILLVFFPYSRFLKIGIVIASIGVAIGILNNYGTVIFQANLRLDLVTLADVLTKVITILFIVLFVFLKRGFYSILNTILIGNLAGAVLIIFLLKKFIPFNLKFSFNLAKKIIKKSIPIGFTSLFALAYFKVDTLLLSVIRGTAEVGIYSLAYKVIENLLVLWGFYMATLYPLLSSLLSKRKTQEAWGLWRKSLLIALASSVIIIIIGFAFAPFVIRVLGGKEFEASVIVLRILLFSLPLFFVNNLFYHSFLLKEKIKFPLIAIGSSAIINLILNLIFIPRFGYIAAAFNFLITQTCLLIFYLFFFKVASLYEEFKQ